jgi:hypothetical protein
MYYKIRQVTHKILHAWCSATVGVSNLQSSGTQSSKTATDYFRTLRSVLIQQNVGCLLHVQYSISGLKPKAMFCLNADVFIYHQPT